MLAAGLPLAAVGACEWLAEPEPEAPGWAEGPDEQAAGEPLGEAPHMVALAREIPGFGGYWYEHESAPAPGAAGADDRPDGGRLVIALTEAGARSFPAARRAVLASRRAAHRSSALLIPHERIAEPPPEVVERVVEYSFIELARHRTRLRALFAVPEVVSLAVDEEANRIVIGLDDLSKKADVVAVVTELAVPVEAISFSQGSRVRMGGMSPGSRLPRPFPLGGAARLDGRIPDGKLRGGYQVQAEGGKKCTLGFTAVLDNGGLVFVSNSHCSKTPWRMDFGDWGQHDTTNLVGVEVDDPPVRRCWKGLGRVDCRDSDASMMAVNTDVSIALGEMGRTDARHRECTLGLPNPFVDYCSVTVDSVNPAIFITNTRYGSDKGNVLDKIGSATGWTWGYVTETCQDTRSEITDVVVLCADVVDFPVSWGDSGAPVFSYLGESSAEFRGIVFGMLDPVRDWGGVHEKGVFQDLEQIQWDLETFTVIDYFPHVRIIGRDLVPSDQKCTWTSETLGVPPFRYEWSGILHGSGASVTGVVEDSGWLRLTITDPLDRTARDSLEVTVGGGLKCGKSGNDTIILETPPPSGS